jgi:NAD(P)-dependent dehydrogenase (short-subunit alcohol dehydrogenase family)
VLDVNGHHLLNLLEEAAEAGFLVRKADAAGAGQQTPPVVDSVILESAEEDAGEAVSLGARFAFVHDRRRDALHERQDGARRRRTHARIAEAIAARGGADPDQAAELALHAIHDGDKMETERKVALVTGANQGIGLEVARKLGAQGYRVLVGARDAALGERAAGELRAQKVDARFVRVDIGDHGTHAAAAADIAAREGRLDTLVNNAGLSGGFEGQAPSVVRIETLREIFEVDVFGQVALLPLLRKSPAARIVEVSSGLGSLTQQSDPAHVYHAMNLFAYNASKAALNNLTVALAKELAGTSIKVNSADPGWCRTDLGSQAAPRSAEQGAAIIAHLARSATTGRAAASSPTTARCPGDGQKRRSADPAEAPQPCRRRVQPPRVVERRSCDRDGRASEGSGRAARPASPHGVVTGSSRRSAQPRALRGRRPRGSGR